VQASPSFAASLSAVTAIGPFVAYGSASGPAPGTGRERPPRHPRRCHPRLRRCAPCPDLVRSPVAGLDPPMTGVFKNRSKNRGKEA
jgi:hypothetical protein